MARRAEALVPWFTFGGLLLAWEGVSRSGWVEPLLLPPPSRVLVTAFGSLIGVHTGGYPLLAHAAASLVLLAGGFGLGLLAGVVVGIAVGVSPLLFRALGPLLGFLLPIPAIAWAPVAMVWIGLGAPAIIAVVAFACFSEVVYSVATGVRGVPRLYVWQAESLGAGRRFVFVRILLPAAFPATFAGLKLGLAASWRSLVGAEMFAGASRGLGFVIYDARPFFATDVMFGALLLIAALSLLIEQGGLRALERRTLERWGLTRTLEV